MKLSPIVEDKPSKAVRFESAYAQLWNAFPEHVKLHNGKIKYRKEKSAARKAEYYQANKEKIAARKAEYYQANKEKLRAYFAKYREANKEKIKAYGAKRRR